MKMQSNGKVESAGVECYIAADNEETKAEVYKDDDEDEDGNSFEH